jgi:uncharacterized protein YycO
MDSISSNQGIQRNYPAQKPREAKTEAGEAQVKDTFTPTGSTAETFKAGGGSIFTALLDTRIPTVTKEFSEADRNKVMDLIRPGDIILETNDAYPGWQFLEKLVFGSSFTHAAIYEGDGQFIEATTGDPSGKGVVRNDLKEYLHGRISLEVIRPDYKTPDDVKSALDHARSQLGKPYDSKFVMENKEEIYCAELVKDCLEAMPNPIKAPEVNFFGKKAVGPNAFQKLPNAQVVFSTGSGFFKSRLAHYPFYAGGIAGAIAGGAALGPLGAIGGFVAGALATTLAGNKIQAGEFSLFPSGH